MSINKNKNKKGGYAQLDNSLLNNVNISFRALGVLAYLLSKPPNWEVRMSELANCRKEGRDAIRAVMRELISAGYVARYKLQSEVTGQINGCSYDVYEEPLAVEYRDFPDSIADEARPKESQNTGARKLDFPSDGFPVAGKPVAGFLPPINTVVKKEIPKKSYPQPFPVERGSSFIDPGIKGRPRQENGRTDYARLIQTGDPLAGIIPELFPGFKWEDNHDAAKYYARLRADGRLPDRDLLTLQKFYRADITSEIAGWKTREPKILLRDKLPLALQVIREFVRDYEIAPINVKLSGELWEPELMVDQAIRYVEGHGMEDDFIPPSQRAWTVALVRFAHGKPLQLTPERRAKILQELVEHFDALPHLKRGKVNLPEVFGGITETEVTQAREVWVSSLRKQKEELEEMLLTGYNGRTSV